MKKISIFVLVLLSSFLLVSCKENKPNPIPPGPGPGDETTDTIAPAFLGLSNGKLVKVEHLQGETVDLLEGVKAIDETDGNDVTITISNDGGYNKDKFGEYEVTYQAADKAGNKATAKRDVIVHETLEVVLDVLTIGDDFIPIQFNRADAFELLPDTGAKFRSSDMVQVMDKDFFLNLGAEGFPVFPYATLALINKEGKVKYARFAAGAALEIDEEGTINSKDLTWDMATNGFGGIVDAIETHLGEEEGYVVFAGPTMKLDSGQSTPGRIFLTSKLFYSEYVGGGGVLAAVQDVDVTKVVADVNLQHEVVIKKPVAVATPVLSISRHKLLWDKVENAYAYKLFIDGEAQEDLISGTEFDLLTLDLSPETSLGYKIEIVALTSDQFKWSNSEKSESIVYKRVELIGLNALTVTLKEGVLSWTLDEGAAGYEVIAMFAGVSRSLGIVTETSVNLADLSVGYEGVNDFYVIAVGDLTHSDSLPSNIVKYRVPYVTETLTIGGYETEVVVYTAENYFLRRNGFLEGYLYKVTGLKSYTGKIIEASSTIVLLSKDGEVKNVRTPWNYEYTKDGWALNAKQTQMDGLQGISEETDYLLVGKNGMAINFKELSTGTPLTNAQSRDFLAHFFMSNMADITGAPGAGEGWKATGENDVRVNPKDVLFTLK